MPTTPGADTMTFDSVGWLGEHAKTLFMHLLPARDDTLRRLGGLIHREMGVEVPPHIILQSGLVGLLLDYHRCFSEDLSRKEDEAGRRKEATEFTDEENPVDGVPRKLIENLGLGARMFLSDNGVEVGGFTSIEALISDAPLTRLLRSADQDIQNSADFFYSVGETADAIIEQARRDGVLDRVMPLVRSVNSRLGDRVHSVAYREYDALRAILQDVEELRSWMKVRDFGKCLGSEPPHLERRTQPSESADSSPPAAPISAGGPAALIFDKRDNAKTAIGDERGVIGDVPNGTVEWALHLVLHQLPRDVAHSVQHVAAAVDRAYKRGLPVPVADVQRRPGREPGAFLEGDELYETSTVYPPAKRRTLTPYAGRTDEEVIVAFRALLRKVGSGPTARAWRDRWIHWGHDTLTIKPE